MDWHLSESPLCGYDRIGLKGPVLSFSIGRVGGPAEFPTILMSLHSTGAPLRVTVVLYIATNSEQIEPEERARTRER